MKHFFTILFATLILFSCIFGFEVQAYGEEHDRSEYDVDTYYETLARSFESFMDRDYRQYLASDTVSFPLIADDLKNSGTFQATLSAKHFLTDKNWSDFFAGDFTLEDVQVQYYKTALSCLLMTFEDNCSSILENESADRATNSWREYVASGASMTASVLSEFADGNLSVALELCGLSIDTIADGLSTVEQFQALEIETDMYSAYRDFLELLVDKTDDRLLQIAANNLVRAVDMCYSYRMEHLSEYADLVIDVESDYFFSVFDSALKDLESAGTALPSELTALKGLSSVLSGAGKFMLGAKLGELGWDFVIGSSKTITHYYEICAMSSVRRVLIDEIDSLYSSIEGDDRIETIEQIRNLLWDLTCVTAFGEHCAYRILSEDSGILSDIRRWFHGETDDAWYENVIETINNTKIGIDDIIPDWDYFLLESDDPPVYLKSGKVLLAVNAYDENDELAEVIHFDYNENGLISRSYHDSYSGGILTDWGYDYIYTYDEAGRLISRYYYVDQWDSGFEDVIRSYDSNGLLVSDNMYSEGEVSVEKEYAYDEDGRLVWERAINGSPFLGGKVKNEYSYSYHTDEHDQTVGVRHNETDPSAEDTEIIYNAVGQLIQGYKSELANAFEGKVKYEYLDDPYFCIRDEFSTFSYPYDIEETRFTNIRYAIILDSAGQEVESFWLGSPETAQMNYDENGYLVSVDNIENTYYIKCEFIYGAPGEEPETSNTDTAQQLPPLSYEERTEHYDHVISGGILTGTSDLAYPYFTDDSPIAAMLNESIEGVVDERRVTDVETDEETEEFFKEMADQGLPPGLNDVEVTVTYNGSNLVSLLYCYSDYGSGAAHVYTRYEGHTYDIGTCEELDYRDLAGSSTGRWTRVIRGRQQQKVFQDPLTRRRLMC